MASIDPDSNQWQQLPLRLQTDLEHGGRWTSLRTDDGAGSGREWLWRNDDAAVAADRQVVDAERIAGGGEFVDAGGGEECFPQVRGVPDHGIAWVTPWSGEPARARVDTAYGTLNRQITHRQNSVRVDYDIEARHDFVHAAHLLLELSTDARLDFPAATPMMTVLDWPVAGEQTSGTWPQLPAAGKHRAAEHRAAEHRAGEDLAGDDLSLLGEADGTARCAIVTGVCEVWVVDQEQALRLRWDGSAATAAMVWRNLEGFPADSPYRSIGIEPMMGTGAAMDEDGSLPAGQYQWWIEIEAWQRR